MCFKSKIKTPKQNTNLPAPEPVMAEEPKGVEFGSEDSGSEGENTDENSTGKITKIDRVGASSDVPSAISTATSHNRKKSTMSSAAVRKSLSGKANK